MIIRLLAEIKLKVKVFISFFKILLYLFRGRKSWTLGYSDYKIKNIKLSLSSEKILKLFKNKKINQFGLGIDERCIEYPWIFSKINDEKEIMLDAGSTFNFDFILRNKKIKNKDITIFTYFPENDCFFKKRISYVYGDLRYLYFKDITFDLIISQSTIEHIGMDNSIYGYKSTENNTNKNFDYLFAITEMERVLKPNGNLLITFPFGKYENHGFFQQFDEEMLQKIVDILQVKGLVELDFFKYEKLGWRYAEKIELKETQSYNPHTGKGKFDDGAAHCRGIACINFKKY